MSGVRWGVKWVRRGRNNFGPFIIGMDALGSNTGYIPGRMMDNSSTESRVVCHIFPAIDGKGWIERNIAPPVFLSASMAPASPLNDRRSADRIPGF